MHLRETEGAKGWGARTSCLFLLTSRLKKTAQTSALDANHTHDTHTPGGVAESTTNSKLVSQMQPLQILFELRRQGRGWVKRGGSGHGEGAHSRTKSRPENVRGMWGGMRKCGSAQDNTKTAGKVRVNLIKATHENYLSQCPSMVSLCSKCAPTPPLQHWESV